MEAPAEVGLHGEPDRLGMAASKLVVWWLAQPPAVLGAGAPGLEVSPRLRSTRDHVARQQLKSGRLAGR